MTLVRYNVNGTIDTSFGSGGFATRQFAGTPNGRPGTSGAVAMTQDAAGNIIVAGFGGSQSMVVARFTRGRRLRGERRLLRAAPHRLHGSRGRGQAQRQHRARGLRPRSPRLRRRAADGAVGPLRPARRRDAACQRQQHDRLRHVLGQRHAVARLERRRPRRRQPDGTGADPALGGRVYDAVVALPGQPLRGRDHERPRRHRLGAALLRHRRRHARRRSTGAASALGATSLHALALLGDGSVLAAGESTDPASPPLARCSSPRSPPAGRWPRSAPAASRAPSSPAVPTPARRSQSRATATSSSAARPTSPASPPSP